MSHITQYTTEFNKSFIDKYLPIREGEKMHLYDEYNRFITVPEEVITCKSDNLVIVYMYVLLIRPFGYGVLGVNHNITMNVSLGEILDWANYTSTGGARTEHKKRVYEVLCKLEEIGIIKIRTPKIDIKEYENKKSVNGKRGKAFPDLIEIEVDDDKTGAKENSGIRFAKIYYDEIRRIFEIKEKIKEQKKKKNEDNENDSKKKSKGNIKTINDLFKVFLYLRLNIRQRVGKSEDKTIEEEPEVFWIYYYKFSKEIGVGRNTIALCCNYLQKAHLIYKEHKILKVQDENSNNEDDYRYVTLCNMFCNTYLRYDDYVIRGGDTYCIREVNSGFKKMIDNLQYKKFTKRKKEDDMDLMNIIGDDWISKGVIVIKKKSA